MEGIVFDIGQTLAYYPFPFNWSALYRPAFEHIASKFDLQISEAEYEHIGATLSKYNARINPREEEISSDVIFAEILSGTNMPVELMDDIKKEFYLFFRRDVVVYDEVEDTLKKLKDKGIPTATLSDVAYGMDNKYALDDIAEVVGYIDFPYTSNDVGYRKPSGRGLLLLSEKMNVPVSKLAFVGDEKKDIECAKNAGAIAVLINRTDEEKDFGQDYTIRSLDELLDLLDYMKVRKAVPEDSNIVGEVHSAAWKSAYRGIFPDEYIDGDTPSKRASEFLESIKDDRCSYYLLEEDGHAAGIVKTYEENDTLEIESIYILDEYRGKGIGREFMEYIKTYRPQKCISLWVLEVNAKARRFYENNGFVMSGESRTIKRGNDFKQLRYNFCKNI